jgi:hypothetical protein
MIARIGLVLFVLSLLSPTGVLAQDARVVGTVVDDSNAVLPGVTITATELTTGRRIVGVTAEQGEYRLAGLPPGRYTIQAELSGFAPTVLSDVELLVGQNATITFKLRLATVEETVTVSGTTPLVDTRAAQVAGNVDRRQMEELPINGRNWMELSMMVKGVTANTVSNRPGVSTDAKFQLNLDGQEITQNHYNFIQPKISREAIAEYQIVTNMFDVTLGRSAGIQVQAITRAGTNNVQGSFYGFFRDDSLNAKDFFTQQLLPYSNQQIGGTVGGPIITNKMHYFVSFENEREPNTSVLTPAALSPQTISLPSENKTRSFLGRVDYDLGTKGHLAIRGTYFNFPRTGALGSGAFPTQASIEEFDSAIGTLNWSRVVRTNLMQELNIGYYHHHWNFRPNDNVPLTPEYVFPGGLTVGPRWNYPQDMNPWELPGVRYGLTWLKGAHDLKVGGEFLRTYSRGNWPLRARGQFFFSAVPADIRRRIPIDAWNDASRWDLSGLDPLVIRFDQYIAPGDDWNLDVPRPTSALWLGDTWKMNNRLTINMGVRYDLAWGDTAPPGVTETDIIINNGLFTENVGFRNDIRDLNNVAPRAGFVWNADDQGAFVIRGGSGLFYGNVSATQGLEQQLTNRLLTTSYANDGQPGFLSNPTRGVTADDYLSGRVPLRPQSPSPIAHDFVFPYAWQSILGFQKQLTSVIGFDADLTYIKSYNEDSQRDPNLFYDPATGFPKNVTVFGRPNLAYGPILLRESKGRSDYLALASSFTRRYHDNYQLGLTYTVMFSKRDMAEASSGYSGGFQNPFNPDAEWGTAGDFQRHTVRVNGIYRMPWGFSLAGLFRYGSGTYSSINAGINPLGTGSNRIRRDLTQIQRNTFLGDPYQSLDLRISKEFPLVRNVRLTAMAEVFNLYNYERYGYNLLETSPTFGTRNSSAGQQPRSVQLAFKLSF